MGLFIKVESDVDDIILFNTFVVYGKNSRPWTTQINCVIQIIKIIC